MTIKTTLKLLTYNCKLTLIITDQPKVEIAKVYKKHKVPNDVDYEIEGVLLTPVTTDYYIIITSKYLLHNTIAHEIYHAAHRICEHREIKDEEAKAWLAG